MKTDQMGHEWADTKGTIVVFDDTGDMSVIHDGSVDMAELIDETGTGAVTFSGKCTEVDWDPKTNEWVSELRDGTILCRGKDREKVVIDEHRILANMVSRGARIPDNNWRSTLVRDIRRFFRRFS